MSLLRRAIHRFVFRSLLRLRWSSRSRVYRLRFGGAFPSSTSAPASTFGIRASKITGASSRRSSTFTPRTGRFSRRRRRPSATGSIARRSFHWPSRWPVRRYNRPTAGPRRSRTSSPSVVRGSSRRGSTSNWSNGSGCRPTRSGRSSGLWGVMRRSTPFAWRTTSARPIPRRGCSSSAPSCVHSTSRSTMRSSTPWSVRSFPTGRRRRCWPRAPKTRRAATSPTSTITASSTTTRWRP